MESRKTGTQKGFRMTTFRCQAQDQPHWLTAEAARKIHTYSENTSWITVKFQRRRFFFLKSIRSLSWGKNQPFTLSVKNKHSDSPTKITLSFIRDILTLNDKQRPEGHWTKKQLIACLWNLAPVSSLCLSENRVSLVWPASAAGRKAHSFNCPHNVNLKLLCFVTTDQQAKGKEDHVCDTIIKSAATDLRFCWHKQLSLSANVHAKQQPTSPAIM